MNDHIDAEVRPLAVREEAALDSPMGGILDARTPEEYVERLQRVCRPLVDFVRQRGLAHRFRGDKEHIELEAWQFLGSMPWIRCNAVVEWVRELPDKNGFEARALCYRDGQVVGAAESRCDRNERNWDRKDYFQLESMAQTRAMSRAFQGPLRFIFVAAGYSPTSAEDMGYAGPRSDFPPASGSKPAEPPKTPPSPVSETGKAGPYEHRRGVTALMALCHSRGVSDSQRYALSAKLFGREHTADLNVTQLRELYREISMATNKEK